MRNKKTSDKRQITIAILAAFLVCIAFGTDSRIRTEGDTGARKTTQSVDVSKSENTKADDLAENKTGATSQKTTYKVLSVVDGDTIKVEYEGRTTSVRLIGVNTPETVDPRKDVECFGKEASQFLKSKLEGQTVTMEADSTQSDRDKYNRLLRYIYLDGKDVSLMLIENGYGYEYTYNVPYQKQTQYKNAQTIAPENKRGLWADGVCAKEDTAAAKPTVASSSASSTVTPTTSKPATTTNSTTPSKPATTQTTTVAKPATTTTAKPATSSNTSQVASSAPSQNCNIKGNINSKKEKIYHMPGQVNYDTTKIDTSKGERWFCSEAEAQQAGWRKAKR